MKMKKILTLLFVSVLGGALTLTAYKLLIEEEPQVITDELKTTQYNIPVNYGTHKANLVAAENVDFTNAAEKTINAVVHVKNTTMSKGYTSFEDLFFGKSSGRTQIGTGSGVIFSPDGLIITNNHVIQGAQTIEVTTNENKTFTAELVGTDPKTDIALLKIDADEDLPFTQFADSDNAKIGEWVLAVGNPFNLTSTVTAGIISAKARNLDQSGRYTQSFIQTDAAVNPGNSGGALVNTNGELIGINTAITSKTGSYIGYSFAVPSNIARKVVEDILEFGNVQNGILGVTGGALNSKVSEELGVKETEGFFVNNVELESGAARAGIKDGDIIKRLDNVEINKFADLKGYLSTKRPNDVVNVTILRDGEYKILPVKLEKVQSVRFSLLGTLKNANKQELKKYDLDYGVKISDLSDRYQEYWKENGIEEGAIVTAINGKKLYSIEDVNQINDNRSEYDNIQIELINKKGEKERYNFK